MTFYTQINIYFISLFLQPRMLKSTKDLVMKMGEKAVLKNYSLKRSFLLIIIPIILADISTAQIYRPTNSTELINDIDLANTTVDDDIIDLNGKTFVYTISCDAIPDANCTTINGLNALPPIQNATELGGGAGKLSIINGSIERHNISNPSVPPTNFRFLEIQPGGDLTLLNITLNFGYIDTGVIDIYIGNGGAIFNSGNLTMQNCILSNNTANAAGGAIFNDATGIINNIENSVISNNTTNTNWGGGILNIGIINSINNSTISSNNSDYLGGGICNNNFINSISNSSISNNIAGGGDVLHSSTDPTVGIRSIQICGGGIMNNNGAKLVSISNNTISGNSASANGGGICNSTSGVITNIVNNTISANTAGITGGGIAILPMGIISLLASNIIANNTAPLGPDIYNPATISSESNNLLLSNDGVPTIINGNNNDIVGFDPMLGPLQDNGGSTFTMALLPGSLAINNGLNLNNLLYDQRGYGYPRVVCAVPDIGAYEWQKCQ
jgi:hypothetical protein